MQLQGKVTVRLLQMQEEFACWSGSFYVICKEEGEFASAQGNSAANEVESAATDTKHSMPSGENGGLRAAAVAHASVNSLYL